jgi:hypothetical protein
LRGGGSHQLLHRDAVTASRQAASVAFRYGGFFFKCLQPLRLEGNAASSLLD